MNATNKGLVTMVVVAALAAPGLAEEKYDLSKVPKFLAGDRVTCTATSRSSTSILDKDGKVTRSEKQARSAEFVQEVLAVGRSAQVASFRTVVASARWVTSSDVPKDQAFEKRVAVAGIYGTSRLEGGRFVTDTKTVAGAAGGRLKASQIALIKQLFLVSVSFRAYSVERAALLPAAPVAQGRTWTPAPAALKRWADECVLPSKLRSDKPRGQFKLVSVEGARARVRGLVRLRTHLAGAPIEPTIEVEWTIHLPTGRWLTESVSLTLSAKIKDTAIALEARRLSAISFTRGSGRASQAPKGLHDLGWADPGKDTNSFRDAARGISLNVPAEYRPQMPARGNIVARFVSPAGAELAVTQVELRRPADFEEILPGFLKNIEKSVEGYKQIKTEAVSLRGNVPAVLIIGRAMGGKVDVLRLFAIDDRRAVVVLGAAGADKPQLLVELTGIAKSLRTFEGGPAGKTPPVGQR